MANGFPTLLVTGTLIKDRATTHSFAPPLSRGRRRIQSHSQTPASSTFSKLPVAASTRSDGQGTGARARHRRRRYCAEPFSPIRVAPGVAFVSWQARIWPSAHEPDPIQQALDFRVSQTSWISDFCRLI